MKDFNIGVLITNIGTPDQCDVKSVRNYLRKFLGDPRVLKIPSLIRWFLLEGVILRTRPQKSLHAYKKIWQENGSPLKIITGKQKDKIQFLLNHRFPEKKIHVKYGMSYSSPNIFEALEELTQVLKCEKIVILPLYPQFSATTTSSTFDFISQYFSKKNYMPSLSFIHHYADHPDYIKALAEHIKNHWHGKEDWHLLFSFHGIPQDYADAGDPYKCFCELTAIKLTEQLGLKPEQWTMSFQSRLGPRTWLQPYTDKTLINLAKTGVKNILTICPGFASDCLETLEEMSMQNKDIFLEAGGQEYYCLPCLNDDNLHMEALANIIAQEIND